MILTMIYQLQNIFWKFRLLSFVSMKSVFILIYNIQTKEDEIDIKKTKNIGTITLLGLKGLSESIPYNKTMSDSDHSDHSNNSNQSNLEQKEKVYNKNNNDNSEISVDLNNLEVLDEFNRFVSTPL